MQPTDSQWAPSIAASTSHSSLLPTLALPQLTQNHHDLECGREGRWDKELGGLGRRRSLVVISAWGLQQG
jgi:hypothetical protein